MAFEQRVAGAEFGENLVFGHIWKSEPFDAVRAARRREVAAILRGPVEKSP